VNWLRVSIAALAVGAGVSAYLYALSPRNASTYRLARVERGALTTTVSAKGNLNAVSTIQVGSQVSGRIKELYADFNSPVRKGQLIARIDPEVFEAKVNEARAALDAAHSAVLDQEAQVQRANANVEKARATWAEGQAQTAKAQVAVADTRRALDRTTALYSSRLIARSEADTAQARYDAAVAQLDAARAKEQALSAATDSAAALVKVAEATLQSRRPQVAEKQAALELTRVNLEHTAIRAPVDGVIIWRAVEVGQTVAASLQVPTLFRIAEDLAKMQAETFVDEADIGGVRLGHRAIFTVDAFPGETFAGTVVQIRKAPQTVENVVTYVVVVAVDNQGGRLLPDMTANVRIIVAEKADVLNVPNAALRVRLPAAPRALDASMTTPSDDDLRGGLRGRVWIPGPDGKPWPVPLTLGITDGAATEVLGGDLKEGQDVIVGTGSPSAPTVPLTRRIALGVAGRALGR
jgi:HlyD family secretion protein